MIIDNSPTDQDTHPAGKRISIVCFPKSGSTFITKSLCEYTGAKQVLIATSAEVQEVSAKRLEILDLKHPSFISQTHCLPTKHALAMHVKYGMETVLIYRNVMDCLASLRDMYVERVETGAGIWEGVFVSQWGAYSENFLKLGQSEQFDFMIEGALNWYLTFFAMWQKKIREDGYPATVLRYEDFFADQEANFLKLVDRLDLHDEEKARTFALPDKEAGAKGVRFNVGRAGRGRELLSKAQQDRILSAARIMEKGTGCDLSDIIHYDR